MDFKKIMKLIDLGIEAVHPLNLFHEVRFEDNVLKIGKKSYTANGRIFVIGAGKASGAMANALEVAIGAENIFAGVINTTKKYKTKVIKINLASHPLPDSRGVRGTKEILDLKEKYDINKKDIILCLISGGGSALLVQPTVSLKEFQKINDDLIKSGANIKQINKERKKYSLVKGGKLAKHFAPAKVISLIISDVVGDDLKTIASGPTISFGAKNILLANNKTALLAIKESLIDDKVVLVKKPFEGDTEEVARKLARLANKIKSGVLIAGGETTLTIPKKHGKGGRNQHMTLALLRYLKGNFIATSIGTDGQDYIKGIAGGIVTNKTSKKGLDKALKTCDSYYFLKKNNGLVKMKYTGTNVCDIVIIAKN